MREEREEFVEPEVIKHEEKLADVTLQAGSGDIGADGDAGPAN
jgi:hypothetical protein